MLYDPRGLCAVSPPSQQVVEGGMTAAEIAAFRKNGGAACQVLIFLIDRTPAARLMRLALRQDGSEIAGMRKTLWPGPRSGLADPQDLCVSPDGARLLVTDAESGRGRVVVFDSRTLDLLGSFGAITVGDGRTESLMQLPYGIVCHGRHIYVADQGLHELSVFVGAGTNADGGPYQRTRTLLSKGTAPGQCRRPRGLCILSDGDGDGDDDGGNGDSGSGGDVAGTEGDGAAGDSAGSRAGSHGGGAMLLLSEAKRVQLLGLDGTALHVVDHPQRGGTLWGAAASWCGSGLLFTSDGLHVHVLEHAARRREMAAVWMERRRVQEREAQLAHAQMAQKERERLEEEAREVARRQAEVKAKAEAAEAARAEKQAAMEEERAKRLAKLEAAAAAAEEQERTKRKAAKLAAKEKAERTVRAAEARAAEVSAAKRAKQAARRAKEEQVEEILKAEAQARAKREREANEERAARLHERAAKEAASPAAKARKAKEDQAIRASMEIAARAAAEAMKRRGEAERAHRWAEAAEAAEAAKRSSEHAARWEAEMQKRRATEREAEARERRQQDEEEARRREVEQEERRQREQEAQEGVREGAVTSDDDNDDDDEEDEDIEQEERDVGWGVDLSGLFDKQRWPWQRQATEEEAARAEVEQDQRERAAASAAARRAESEAWQQQEWRERQQQQQQERVQQEQQASAEAPAAARTDGGGRDSVAAAEAAMRAQLTGMNLTGLEPGGLDAQPQRDEKAAERDAAVSRILARTPQCRSLRMATGLSLAASDSELRKKSLLLLRLLHPDYVINLPLKGTKQHARIEAAFKKLSALRDI